MAKAQRKCRICGKQYEACRSVHDYDGTFRWQMVACCKEHGEEYLRRILEYKRRKAAAEGENTDGSV